MPLIAQLFMSDASPQKIVARALPAHRPQVLQVNAGDPEPGNGLF
jgi:hypothetical protein